MKQHVCMCLPLKNSSWGKPTEGDIQTELQSGGILHLTILAFKSPPRIWLFCMLDWGMGMRLPYHHIHHTHIHYTCSYLILSLWAWPGNETITPYLPHNYYSCIPWPSMVESVNRCVFVVWFMLPSQQLHAAVQMARVPHLRLASLFPPVQVRRFESGSHISGPSSSVEVSWSYIDI